MFQTTQFTNRSHFQTKMSFQHNPRPASTLCVKCACAFSDPITIANSRNEGEIPRNHGVVSTSIYNFPETAQEGSLGNCLSASGGVPERERSRATSEGSDSTSIFLPWRSSRPGNISSPPTATHRQRESAFISARTSSKHPMHSQNSHEWTLFEQMMENEGQLPPTPSSDSRVTYRSMSSFAGRLATRNSSPHVQVGLCHSPTQEDHVSDHPSEIQGENSPSTQVSEDFGICDYDSECDSDTSATSQCTIEPSGGATERGSTSHHKWKLPAFTPLYCNILKCAIAYFIASLFTFYRPLSDFIGDLSSYGPGARGPSPSAHMVATVYVLHLTACEKLR